MSRTEIKIGFVAAAIGPYSQAIKSGDMLFISGQLPVNIKIGELSYCRSCLPELPQFQI